MDGLGLESVGIQPPEKGIEVDERLRAGEGVWAIGDVTGIMPFTHVGAYQARVAAADMLGQVRARGLPRDPARGLRRSQVAAAGATEGERARRSSCPALRAARPIRPIPPSGRATP